MQDGGAIWHLQARANDATNMHNVGKPIIGTPLNDKAKMARRTFLEISLESTDNERAFGETETPQTEAVCGIDKASPGMTLVGFACEGKGPRRVTDYDEIYACLNNRLMFSLIFAPINPEWKEEFPDGTPPERGTETSEKPLCSMRPIDVHDPDFNTKFTTEVARLVSQCNVHHHTDTCYKYGSKSCRFDFKRPAVDIAKIEDGVIFLRRRTGNGWVNNYNDIMTVALRCNTDIKFVCNGKDGTALSFYITDYITKKSLTTHNAIPLIIAAAQDVERGINKCKPNPLYTTHMQNSRDLVVKCLNKLTTHSERSGPEVATLLMDKPLHYTSHKYKKVVTAPFDYTLRMANRTGNEDAEDDISESDNDDMSLENDTTDSYIMTPSDTGSITLSNQRMDYLYRSNDLSSVCCKC